MRLLQMIVVVAATLVAAGGPALGASKAEQQQDIRKMADETLARLYKVQPGARNAVSKAAGYAVFSNVGLKVLALGSGTGKGVLIDNRSKSATYMKMAELQAGVGFGVKRFRLVWVFENKSDMDRFANSGWEVGAQGSVAAQTGGKGAEVFAGAVVVSPGVWLYQLLDDGLAAELTAKGTRYYKDSDLN